MSDSSQFGVISKAAEGEFGPVVQIIKDVKQDCTKYWPLEYAASHWSPTCLCAIDHDPLSLSILLVFNEPHCLLIQPILHQLVYKYLKRDSVKDLAEIGVDNINCFTLTCQDSHFTAEVHYIYQVCVPLGETLLTIPDDCLYMPENKV